MTGFHVEPEQLASHSESVNRVGESLDEIGSAAGSENFGGLVYGVLFDPLVLAGLGVWAEHIHGVIEDNATVARAIAGALKSNADTYAGIEQTTTSTVQKSGSW